VFVPKHHLRLFLKLLAVWLVLMAPGLFYMGPWPWIKAVGLATVGLVLVFLVGEFAFGRSRGES
jgi:hypothetical protein